jgi:integrase
VENGRPATGYEVRKHLSRFFNWATDRELLADNPIHSMKRGDLAPKGEAGRALADVELRYIWQSACTLGYPFGDLFKLLILTGQRRNEWASARLSEINFDKRWLEIPRARYKGGRDHIVPLVEEALSILEGLPVCSTSHNFILSSRNGEVPVSGFSKAKAMLDKNVLALMKADDPDAVLQKYRVHDFRVTCETRLANLGFNQETRDAVLGHAKLGLQKTYNKYDYSEEKIAALNEYANEIKRIVR